MLMATAKEQAQKNLGTREDYVNYAGYQKDIENARAAYDTQMQTLQDNYNRLVDTINTNRQKLGNDFTSGRATVANDYYANKNLNTGAQLSSYLRGTGVDAANKTLNRMNLGNELSRLANTYYHGQDELDTNLGYYQRDYELGKQTAGNTLNATLANIGQKQKESENDYAKQLAQLAEQIQSRWDSNANARAQLDLQKSSLAQQVKQYDDNRLREVLAYASQIAGNDINDTNYATNYKKAFDYYRFMYPDVSDEDITKALNNAGIYSPIIVNQKKEEEQKAKATEKREDRSYSSTGYVPKDSTGLFIDALRDLFK